MNKSRFVSLMAGAIATLLVLAGCGDSDEDSGGNGTTFTIASPYATDSLDPYGAEASNNGNVHAAMQIYSRLVRFDDAGKIVPDLAEDWTSNDEGTEWTFNLRDGVEFSDGTPLTAADVVASFERLVSQETPLSANFPDVTATADGDTTVVFTSQTPLLLGRVALVYVTKSGEEDFNKPIGSGPFVVEDFSPSDTLRLTPNENYYGTVPTVDELVFRWIPEVSTRVTALQTGEIDATWGIPDDQVSVLKSDSGLKVESVPSASVITMWFNSSRPAFASAAVRNALWEAIDFDTIIESLFPETGVPSDSIVAPNVLGYSPQTPKTYDPDAAKATLEAEGFDFSKPIEIQYSAAEYQQFIEAVASDLAKIGVQAVPTQKESAVFTEDLLALNWDINFQALGTAAYDSATNTGRLYPCAAGRTGYCNPELDDILAAAGATTDTDEREELYDQANKIIWDDAVGMYPMLLKITYAWRDGITGFTPDSLFMPWLADVSTT